MVLIQTVVRIRIAAVNTHCHQKFSAAVALLAAASMLPQLGLGYFTPNPRKDRDVSVYMDAAKLRVMFTRITDTIFGRICLKAIRLGLTPMAWAATTYSLSRATSTWARVM